MVIVKGVNEVKGVFGMCGREVDAWWDVGDCKMGKAWGKEETNCRNGKSSRDPADRVGRPWWEPTHCLINLVRLNFLSCAFARR